MPKIYLDHAATTPLHPEVKKSMEPYLTDFFGNPQSLHSFGATAKQAIDDARIKVAQLIGAKPEEIYFTASGAESNNFALKGIAGAKAACSRNTLPELFKRFSRHSAFAYGETSSLNSIDLSLDIRYFLSFKSLFDRRE